MVSENQFSGKTYFIQLPPVRQVHDAAAVGAAGGPRRGGLVAKVGAARRGCARPTNGQGA